MHGAGPEFSQVSKPTFKSALPTNLIPKVEIVRCINERDLSDRRPSEIGDNNTRPQLPDTPPQWLQSMYGAHLASEQFIGACFSISRRATLTESS